MNVSIMIAILAIGIVGMFWYSQNKLKGKIHCTFRRQNKTKIEKFVPQKSRYVIFDGGQYNVNTKRITLLLYNRGIHQFFPTYVPSLDFSWYSPNPLDPERFKSTWDTPETREASRQEDSFRAFAKGIMSQIGKKSRFPEWLFPAITIGAIMIIGYLVYQQSQHLSYLEQLIKLGMQ